MKYIIALIPFLFIYNNLHGQQIDFNVKVNLLIEASTDTSEEVNMNTHYFLFDKEGKLIQSQNLLESLLLADKRRNSKIVKSTYNRKSEKKSDEIYYSDTSDNIISRSIIKYEYWKKKLNKEITFTGLDTIVSYKNISYGKNGKKRKVELLKAKCGIIDNQPHIEFNNLDTVVYAYNWINDSACQVLKNSEKNFNITIEPDSIQFQKYHEEQIEYELILKYDSLGRLTSLDSNYSGKGYSKRDKTIIKYDESGVVTALNNGSNYDFREQVELSEPAINDVYRIVWNFDYSNLTQDKLDKINNAILLEVMPDVYEEYFNLL